MDDEAEEMPKLNVLWLVNDKMKAAMDYLTCRLKDKAQNYDKYVARKIKRWNRRLTLQMNFQLSDTA